MNEIIRKAEIKMYLTSAIGSVAVLVMALLEFVAGNVFISKISLILSAVVVVNAVIYLIHKKLRLASYVIGIVGAIVALLASVWGGYEKTGWMVMMIFAPLAFGTFKLKKGIIAVTVLIFVLVGMVTWGYYASWELGYSFQEYAIMIFAYTVLAVITGTAQWEQDKTLEHERKSNLLIAKQEKDLLKFEAAAKQSVEMMVFTDPDGIVIWANEAAERITGFTREEALNRKAGLLWGKLMPKEWYQRMWETIKIKKQTFRAEIENHRKNGEHFFSTITIYPLLNDEGEVEFFVGTQRDITEEKQIDQMKTDFISLASHQLRTPLSSMRWNLEMLLSGDMGKITSKQKEVLRSVYASNQNMVEIVGQLLSISHIESGKIKTELTKQEIGQIIKDSIKDSLVKLKRRGQKLVIKLDEPQLKIETDPKLFGQVVANLLNNAVKYSPEKAEIVLQGTKTKDQYRVTVIDRGIGIPESDRNRLFDKYFRGSNAVKAQAEGTGLGLYLCQIITHLLGGKIDFSSIEGKGSSFWFSVPLNNKA